VASLANPFGGALGQLIGPFWAENAPDVPNLVLYVSIISTIAALPSFLIPAKPPTPPSASSAIEKPHVLESLRALTSNRSFWIIFTIFSIYVGFFNAISSLLNQILGPYGLSEDEAGIAGAVLIVVGLVAAAITSPIIDRVKKYVLMIKVCVPLIGLSYLAFIWAPPTGDLPAPYVILAILGAASFSLMPVALEYLVEVTWPASPEVTSVVSWSGGQLLGGIFIVIMTALKDTDGSDGPKNNMQRSIIFEAVVALVAIIPPMFLGYKKLGTGGNSKGRLLVDQQRASPLGSIEGERV
jgi:Na+/melibiose symporter-like transporter